MLHIIFYDICDKYNCIGMDNWVKVVSRRGICAMDVLGH